MPNARPDVLNHIKDLSERVRRLESSGGRGNRTFVDVNGNALFTIDSVNSKVGLFGLTAAKAATPVTLADVIAVLQTYGMTS